MEQAETLKSIMSRAGREWGWGVKGERTEQGVGDSNVKGEGLFEGLVDTQEERYCPNIPKSLLGHFSPKNVKHQATCSRSVGLKTKVKHDD